MEGNNEGGRKFCGQGTKKAVIFYPPTPQKTMTDWTSKKQICSSKGTIKGIRQVENICKHVPDKGFLFKTHKELKITNKR